MSDSDLPTGWATDVGSNAHVVVASLSDDLLVDGDDGHHLSRVRRIRVDECVTATNGEGLWRAYKVVSVGSGEAMLRCDGVTHLEPHLEPRLAVAFSVTKGTTPESVVRHLTEIGVDRIIPVLSARSIPQWDDRQCAKALLRFRKIADGAVRQCRRATLPSVEYPRAISSLYGHDGVILALPGAPTISKVPVPQGGEWLALVGPEGGFDPEEVEALRPLAQVGLGPHVLRSETAAIALAAHLSTLRMS